MNHEDTLDNIPTSAPLQRSHVVSRIPLGWGSGGKAIEWDIRNAPHAAVIGWVGSGRSIVLRNLIAHVEQHPDAWGLLGVDVSRVELSPYASLPGTLDIGTNVADGLDVLLRARDEMYVRYEKIREAEANHINELDEVYRSMMVVVENASSFLCLENKDESKVEDQLRVRAYHTLCELLNFGHHAGIHVVLSGHDLDSAIFSEAFLGGIQARISMGWLPLDKSIEFLGHDGGTELNRSVRGRGYFQMNGEGQEFQSFFAPQKWFKRFEDHDNEWLSAWEDDGVDLDTLVV